MVYQRVFIRGFTLIELLVVIAIIGILSAVVLASLNTARLKGIDAAVQSNLTTIRSQASLYYENNGYGYGSSVTDSCATGNGNMFDDQNIQRAIAATRNANGNRTVTCNVSVNGSEYAISAQLVTGASKYWCIDSSSVGKEKSTTLGSNTACQ
jgi:prepilin-type N-terminal cleavage/methylation domain-containing protein